MIYKVSKNGTTIVTTLFYKDAAKRYDECIYEGKPGDIIRMEVKKTGNEPKWELARKDWL